MRKRLCIIIAIQLMLINSVFCSDIQSLEYKSIKEKMYCEDTYFENDHLSLTRGELAYFSVALYEYLVNNGGPDVVYSDYSSFVDTSDFDVIRAYKLGIMSGYPNGYFMPDKKATYEEAIFVLMKTIEKAEYTFKATDSIKSSTASYKCSTWAQDSLEKAVIETLIDKSVLTLDMSKKEITRSTFFELLNKILNEKRFIYDP